MCREIGFDSSQQLRLRYRERFIENDQRLVPLANSIGAKHIGKKRIGGLEEMLCEVNLVQVADLNGAFDGGHN